MKCSCGGDIIRHRLIDENGWMYRCCRCQTEFFSEHEDPTSINYKDIEIDIFDKYHEVKYDIAALDNAVMKNTIVCYIKDLFEFDEDFTKSLYDKVKKNPDAFKRKMKRFFLRLLHQKIDE